MNFVTKNTKLSFNLKYFQYDFDELDAFLK